MGFKEQGPTGEAQAKQIIDFLNNNPGTSPAWDAFKAANPQFANASGATGAAGSFAGSLDYFGGQWDASAGRKPGQPGGGSFQDFTAAILSGNTAGAKAVEGGNPAYTPNPTGPTGGAPGTSPVNTANDVAKAIYQWAASFGRKGMPNEGKTPTREDFVAAWGDLGGQVVDWVRTTGVWPDEATFTARVEPLARNTRPGGTVGSTYAEIIPGAPNQQELYNRDYQAKRNEVTDAYNNAMLALQQGNAALAQQQLLLAQKAQADADAIAKGTLQLGVDQQKFDQNQIAVKNALDQALLAISQGNLQVAQGQLKIAQQTADQNFIIAKGQLDISAGQLGVSQGQLGVSQGQLELNKLNDAVDRAKKQGDATGTYVDPVTGQSYETLFAQQQSFQQQIDVAKLTGFYQGVPLMEREQLAIAAAKAGNPLEQMALARGQPIQNYAGMPGAPGAPTYTGQPGATTGGPQMPASVAAIMSGQALGASQGAPGLRMAGAQAQMNETPQERAARMEAYTLSGGNEANITASEQQIRQNLGKGLQGAAYRGAPGGQRRYA